MAVAERFLHQHRQAGGKGEVQQGKVGVGWRHQRHRVEVFLGQHFSHLVMHGIGVKFGRCGLIDIANSKERNQSFLSQ